MKSKLLIGILLVIVIILAWLVFIWDCVANRAMAGTPIDFATIKDCSY